MSRYWPQRKSEMEILGYFVVVGIGFVLGSIGAGGSMLAIPALVYLFSMDMETASAYSLFLVGMTSITGVALKYREQHVSVSTLLFFGMPSLAGSFVSRNWIVVHIPDVIGDCYGHLLTKENLLLTLFALLMFASSITMLLKKKTESDRLRKPKLYLLMLTGTITGLAAGLVGVGGGFFILPALIIFAALPFSIAAGTSLVIIFLNSSFGFCGDLLNRSIDWHFLVPLTSLALLGLLLGYWSHKQVQKLLSQHRFAWFVILMGISILVMQLVR